MRLDGKVALVTGSSSGIGLAITELFAREGARVLALDLVPPADPAGTAGPVVLVQGDASSEADLIDAVGRARDRWGRLDVLVACAGIGRPAPLCDLDPDDFDAVVNVNLRGPFLAMKHAIPVMVATGGGSIIVIGSVQSLVAQPDSAAYAASKGGVLMLTRVAALDYARQGVRANVICPGTIDTPRLGKLTAERIDALAEQHPVHRLGQPGEVAAMALFLASDESSFCTGGAYMVDGGRTAI